jgi:hypothetical protein
MITGEAIDTVLAARQNKNFKSDRPYNKQVVEAIRKSKMFKDYVNWAQDYKHDHLNLLLCQAIAIGYEATLTTIEKETTNAGTKQ